MNLLCPNCQKMLTVPEQYAGQLMKCPLCSNNFTVPALPPGGAPEPPPAPAFTPPSLPPAAPEPAPSDAYGLKSEPMPAFGPPPTPPASSAEPVPAFMMPPASPAPTSASLTSEPPPPAPPASPPPPVSPGNYTDGWRVVFDPKVLQWVVPAALLLVFVLHFFPWIGVYAGPREITSQGAWGAATGGYTKPDPDLKGVFRFLDPDALKKENDQRDRDNQVVSNEPGFSVLIFFYLIPLFFVTLIAALGVVALPFIPSPIPPQVQQLLPWKWAIVAGLNAVMLLFLLLQCVLPFSLENSVAAWVNSRPELKDKADDTTPEQKLKEAQRGEMINRVQRTFWWRSVVVLHLLATIAAGLVWWVEKRGPAKPLPALEMRW